MRCARRVWFGFIEFVPTRSPAADLATRAFPSAPTLEGPYIIKNLVLVAAAFVVRATGVWPGSTAPRAVTRQS